MYTCKCGRVVKSRIGMISHAKSCIKDVVIDAVGVWETVRKGVFRIVVRW